MCSYSLPTPQLLAHSAQSVHMGTHAFSRHYIDFVPQHRKEIPFPQLFLYKSHFSFASLSCWSLDHVWIPRMHCACTAVRLRGGYASLGFLEAVYFRPDAYLQPRSQNVLPTNSVTASRSVPSSLFRWIPETGQTLSQERQDASRQSHTFLRIR